MQTATLVTTFKGSAPLMTGDAVATDQDRQDLDGQDFRDVLNASSSDKINDEIMSQMPLIDAGLPPTVSAQATPVISMVAEESQPITDDFAADAQGSLASPALLRSLANPALTDTVITVPDMPDQSPTDLKPRVTTSNAMQSGPLEGFEPGNEQVQAALNTGEGALQMVPEGAAPQTKDPAQMSEAKHLSAAALVKPSPEPTAIHVEGPSVHHSLRDDLKTHMHKTQRSQVSELDKADGQEIGLLNEPTAHRAEIKAERSALLARSTVQEAAFLLQTEQHSRQVQTGETLAAIVVPLPTETAQSKVQTRGESASLGPVVAAFASATIEAADVPAKDPQQPPEGRVVWTFSDEISKKTTSEQSADICLLGPKAGGKPSVLSHADVSNLLIGQDVQPQEVLVSITSVAEKWAAASSNAPIASMPPAHSNPIQQVSAVVAQPSFDSSGQIELTLAPETLGKLHFDMRPEGAGLAITLSAERPETLELMRRHLPELIAELKQAGVQAGSFSFGSWSQGQPSPSATPHRSSNAPLDTAPDIPALPSLRAATPSSQALDLRL